MFQINNHILVGYKMIYPLFIRKTFLHAVSYTFQNIIAVSRSTWTIDCSKIIYSYMHKKSLRKVCLLRAHIGIKFRTSKQSCDIICSSLIASLFHAANQILCVPLWIINHYTAAVNPYRHVFFIKPSVMKIMYLFFSFIYSRKVLLEHLTVFFINQL